MIHLLIILASIGWLLAFYLLRIVETGDPKSWRTVLPPEDAVRGPNADESYLAVRLNGHEYWFTIEEVSRANERALKYDR